MLKNSKSESLFLVSSAIHTKYGIYNAGQRLEQTINTCKSIKEKCPSDIIILDGGEKGLSEDEQNKLTEYVELIVSFSESPVIKQILSVPSQDIVKNMAELVMFSSFFENMLMDGIHQSYKRIFKMSGRYLLNSSFNYGEHYNATGKIIIRGPYASQFDPAITGGVVNQYMSRLWSFDSEMLPYISNAFRHMFEHMNKRLNEGGYIDIEHLLFVHLNSDHIQQIDKIGVEGTIAPSGFGVSE